MMSTAWKKNNNNGLKIQYEYLTAYLIGATGNALYTYYLIELYIDTIVEHRELYSHQT